MNATASRLPSRPSYFSSMRGTPAQSPAQIFPTVLLLSDMNSDFSSISHQAKLLRSLPCLAQSILLLSPCQTSQHLPQSCISFNPQAVLLASRTRQFTTLRSLHIQYWQHPLCPPSYPFGFKMWRCQQTDVRLHRLLVCYCFSPQRIL
jgi:hypothetical protein